MTSKWNAGLTATTFAADDSLTAADLNDTFAVVAPANFLNPSSKGFMSFDFNVVTNYNDNTSGSGATIDFTPGELKLGTAASDGTADVEVDGDAGLMDYSKDVNVYIDFKGRSWTASTTAQTSLNEIGTNFASAGSTGFSIFLEADGLTVKFATSGAQETDITSTLSVANWATRNHFRIVHDAGTDTKLYVNGTLAATHTTIPSGTSVRKFAMLNRAGAVTPEATTSYCYGFVVEQGF